MGDTELQQTRPAESLTLTVLRLRNLVSLTLSPLYLSQLYTIHVRQIKSLIEYNRKVCSQLQFEFSCQSFSQ